MNTTVFQIDKWHQLFETAKTRTYKNKTQGAFPLKLHGTGYRRLMRREDGPAVYGCFIAICMVAHQATSISRDGYLTDTGEISGVPYDIEDLALKTDMPESLVAATLEFCANPKIGWIRIYCNEELCDCTDITGILQYPRDIHLYSNSNSNSNSVTTGGSEPQEPAPSEQPEANIVISIPLAGNSGQHDVTDEDVEQYSDVYPGIDVVQQLKKCRQWNIDHPRKRKTKRGIRKHISGWLDRAQNDPRQTKRGDIDLSKPLPPKKDPTLF